MQYTESFTESLFRDYGHNDYTPSKKTHFNSSQQSTRPQTTNKSNLTPTHSLGFENSHFTAKNYELRIDELHPPRAAPKHIPRWEMLYNYGVSQGERKSMLHAKAIRGKDRGPEAFGCQRVVKTDQ
jgi:hypothetical protein